MREGHMPDVIDVAVAAGAELGEGPIWDHRSGELLWVDILAGTLHRLGLPNAIGPQYVAGQPLGFVALRQKGGLVLGLRDGFAALGPAGGPLEWLARVEAGNMANRMNDGGCDPSGRVWGGTMELHENPGAGSLYRLDVDHHVSTVLSGVTVSNGVDWDLERRRMYYNDSATTFVDVLDYNPETGEAGNRRHLVEIPQGDGHPDGLTVDAAGFIWVALWGGGAVRRYSPEGALDRVVSFPVSQVSSCCFGGPELEDLYVTSARYGLSAAQLAGEPHAGDVFVTRPGAAGRAAPLFAG
jgi:sugar lactone lactonase YvrE